MHSRFNWAGSWDSVPLDITRKYFRDVMSVPYIGHLKQKSIYTSYIGILILVSNSTYIVS